MTNPFSSGYDPNRPGFGTGGGGTDVNRFHDQDDRDINALSHHHTLGIFPGQASPGDHTHDGKQSKVLPYGATVLPVDGRFFGAALAIGTSTRWAKEDHSHGTPTFNRVVVRSNAANTATATEAKDVIGDVTFTAVTGRKYRIRYNARVISTVTAGTASPELRLRGNNSAVSPTTASTLLQANGTFLAAIGGANAVDLTAEATFACPADMAVGLWTIAGFFAKVAGTAGTVVNADQSAGSKRELTIDEVA